MPSVCFYFEVHQPYRLKPFGALQVGRDHEYFDEKLNAEVMRKVANKCYLPANESMLRLIDRSRPMLDALETLAGRTRHMVQNPNTESAAASAGQGELEPGPHGACPATASTDLPGTPPCPTAKLAREIGRLADFADNPPSSADPLSQPGPG